MSANNRFEVGILGAGAIVSTCHLPALLASREASVAWVADRDAARVRAVGKSFGVRAVVASDKLDDLPPAEVILVTVPYGVREPMYPTLGSKFGAAYVEKPFALTLAEHDRHSACFAPERLAVGFQRRSMGAVRALREVVRSRLFGELERIEMSFGQPGVKTGGRYSSSLAMAGGGVLFEVGVHGLDMALFVADATATEVRSATMQKSHGFDVHTRATLELTRAAGPAVPLELLITVLEYTSNTHVFTFERARVSTVLFGDCTLRVQPHGSLSSFVLGGAETEYPRTANQLFHEHWTGFFEAMRSKRCNATSASESRVTTRAVEQLYDAGARS